MKINFFTSVLLALGMIVAVTTCCTTVFAKNEEKNLSLHEKIEKELTSIKNVKETRVFLYENTAIVAMRTQDVTTKSQTEQVVNDVKNFFAEKYPQFDKVKVTCSMKAFVAIEQLNKLIDAGEGDIEDILDKIPMPRPMPKPMPLPEAPKN